MTETGSKKLRKEGSIKEHILHTVIIKILHASWTWTCVLLRKYMRPAISSLLPLAAAGAIAD